MSNEQYARHPYEAGTPIARFFDAACGEDGQWLRDWEAEVQFRRPDPEKFGKDVQLDGDFNIAAGIRAVMALAWGIGVATALNHAIRNPDGITLRLEHLDGRPWQNPYQEASE